ncbi:MAG: hypothetical protein M1835_000804 [Candelina submexicana]|nr:MAG: hypothetical protein M1835_000804 [Candelina submexicana]
MAAQNDISKPSWSGTTANATPGSNVAPFIQGSATTNTTHISTPTTAASLGLKDRGITELSKTQQQQMFSSLNAIFERAEESEGGVGVRELRPVSDTADDDGRFDHRLEALRDVRGTLDQMWWCNSDFLVTAAEVLADGSRDPKWRKPFGETGVLYFFLGILGTDRVEDGLMLQALRLVGNSCADTDENRQRLFDSGCFPALMKHLNNAVLVSIAVPAIFNVCTDFEPGQQQAASDGLSHELISLLASRSFDGDGLLGYIFRSLELILPLPQALASAPDDSTEVLLGHASAQTISLTDFSTLVNCFVLLLQDTRFQLRLVTKHLFERALTILVESYSRFTGSEELDLAYLSLTAQTERLEDEQLLHGMRDSLIQVLSDVSALPEFSAVYPPQSPLIGSLRVWLTVPQTQLQTCACVMLGNVARSDEICRTMVQSFHVHEPLLLALETSNDSQVLHAASGFLKNLVVLAENKTTVGETRIIRVLARLWSLETLPQIQYAGASLARQLMTGSYRNIQGLLVPLSADPDSPAHSRTYLSLLLVIYEKTDQVSTRTEIARTITAICRILNSAHPPVGVDDFEETVYRFYSLHKEVGRPLASMVSQSQWPVVRSEGWFAFALMAKNQEGAEAVSHAMHNVAVIRPLIETVTGKSFNGHGALETSEAELDQRQVEMKRRDRENALVLISELLRFRGDRMAIMRKHLFEDLLYGRESIHSTYRELSKQSSGSDTSDRQQYHVPMRED